VAADVHGKNHHHDGSFGEHVLRIELILADGTRMSCSTNENAEVFWATVGGMGLTGIIGEVTLKLMPIASRYMRVRHHAARDLEQLFALLQDPALDDRYTVAWIDSMSGGGKLGRGVAMCGHHASADEVPADFKLAAQRSRTLALSLPADLPAWALNPLSIGAFNALYYRCEGSKQQPFLSGQDAYFYPLDAIGHWNRLYGKRGFVQYQCVIPEASAFDGVRELLLELSCSRRPSFLAVLKRLGPQGRGMLSFPMAGYTLALDMPVRDAGTFALLDALDKIVMQHGGRVYLAKDARLAAAAFRAMYPRHGEWLKIKQALDPHNVFSSSQSRRLRMGEVA
jgi:FAD/FMN-containing dehydrogenase